MGRLFVLATLAVTVSGCYVFTAAPSVPVTGTYLKLELNDRGRVGLGDSLGPAASVIEGTSYTSSDSAYALRVSKVGYLNRQSNSWTGERLTISKMFVANARERRFSKGRTGLAGSAVTAAVIAFISSRGLLGSGSNPREEPGGPKPGEQ